MLLVLLHALGLVVAFGARSLLATQAGVASEPLPGLAAAVTAVPPRFLFSINGVSRPLGVAVSPAGDRIYATESDGERETKVFDRDGRPVGSLNPPGTDAATRVPVYVAVSPEGEVYVSDRQSGAIHVYAGGGAYLRAVVAPEGLAGPWAPLALAFDNSGNLLVTNLGQGRHGALVLDREGRLLRQVGEEDQFSFPNGIAVTPSGELLLADSNNGRVVAVDEQGKIAWTLKSAAANGALALPRGLAVDANGRLYVADPVSHAVSAYELGQEKATLLFTVGGAGIKDGQFSFPNSVAIDRAGRLYIADRENNRVQVWTY